LLSETIWVWNRSLTYIPTFLDTYVFYPNLFQIILFLVEWLLFSCGYFLGLFNSIIGFDTLRLNNLLLFLCLGRLVVIGFSIATIYLVYKIGKKLKDSDMGMAAAFFLGFNYLYFRESRFLYYNIPANFFIMLAFLFTLDVFLYAKKRNYILTGLIIGTGTALHYQGIFALIPLVMAHFLRSDSAGFLRRIASKKLGLSLLAALLAFSVWNPYYVWEFGVFIEKLHWNLTRLSHARLVQLGTGGNINGYVSYAVMLLKHDVLFSITALLGAIICATNKKGILLISLPVSLYLCYGRAAEVHPEWITPILPFMALLSACFIVWLFGRKSAALIKQRQLLFISSLAIVISSFLNIVKSDLFERVIDIRIVVENWVARKLPADTPLLDSDRNLIDDRPILQKIGYGFFTPDFKEPAMNTYKGPTIRISGEVIFPYYEKGIIRISVRSKNYYPAGPPDIASIQMRKPGAYFLLVPVDCGEVILRAAYWKSADSPSPEYSSSDTPLTITKFDRAGVDLIVPPGSSSVR